MRHVLRQYAGVSTHSGFRLSHFGSYLPFYVHAHITQLLFGTSQYFGSYYNIQVNAILISDDGGADGDKEKYQSDILIRGDTFWMKANLYRTPKSSVG